MQNPFKVSRYSTDFEQIKTIGRGGFGSVVEAKNKLDGVRYLRRCLLSVRPHAPAPASGCPGCPCSDPVKDGGTLHRVVSWLSNTTPTKNPQQKTPNKKKKRGP